MILAGDVNPGDLIKEVGGTARQALSSLNEETVCSIVILVSCEGRKLVMGNETDEEVLVALNVLGKKTLITSFYFM